MQRCSHFNYYEPFRAKLFIKSKALMNNELGKEWVLIELEDNEC